MCTLTYIPASGSGKIITANRDESPLRNANKLSKYSALSGEEYYIAREPLKGGTNVAISPGNRMSVLLNGAFEPHKMGATYAKSRGILLLESLNFSNLFDFSAEYSLTGIEPFTLLEFQEDIRELRWDGLEVYKKTHDPAKPKIWASAQLYSKEVLEKRNIWFESLVNQHPQSEDVLEFHFKGGEGDPENDLVMNRNGLVQTVSITQLIESSVQSEIKHFDLIENSEQLLDYSN